ncbi:MAG: aspartate--tRNA ligase, partial [Oscillospiraceae bacterium]|nr:aspartate--tRNA ligase [Oscillospiraceae bacterium]
MFQNRTHNCNELRMEHVGERVRLVGWMENVREVGQNFAFVVLRDFYGTTQIVIESEEMMQVVKPLNKESTIAVEGVVRERASKNPKLPTGDIEIVPEKIEVLGKCLYNELPFEINRSREADEANRLKYRYLDLRNPAVKQNIILRCNVVAALRQAMMEHGFLEITTPILTASSPEGARDYLVPARKHPGKFYALPQAPQQFKQLLMTAGFDRYFQIAPCFRDEDARGDRSPGEFYQLDMEMAFADQDDVFAVLEDVLPPIFAKYGKYDIASEAPFRRIPFNEAMERYGSDKPDLRIDLEVQDMTALVEGSEFAPFQNGAVVKAIVVTDCSLARKAVDKLCADVEVQAGQKPYWFKVDEQGNFAGGISKFLVDKHDEIVAALGLKPGCFVGVTAGKTGEAQKTAGVLRKMLGAAVPGHMDVERYEFCWIVDFPMYEIGEESGELEFCHNPFSMPNGGLDILLKAERGEVDPLDIYAFQYDLVCNGVELSSGAVRNHDPEIMVKA